MRTPGAVFGRPSRACAPLPGTGRKVLVDPMGESDQMAQIVEVSITKR